MIAFVLGFLVGVCWIQQSSQLWPVGGWALATVFAATAGWRLRSHAAAPYATLLFAIAIAIAIVVGAAYATVRAEHRLGERLAPALDRETVELTGRVVGLTEGDDMHVRFTFAPDPVATPAGVPPRLVMSWYPKAGLPTWSKHLRAGDRLRLTARLRGVTSLFNPGGFDHAGWTLMQGIGGRGYVDAAQRLGTDPRGVVDRLRADRRDWLRQRVPESIAGVMVAMAIGDQGDITDARWDVLRQTGTAHLVAVSGLHVSIVAMLVGVVVGWMWRRIAGLCVRWPAQRAAVLGGALGAWFYAAMAGFGIPVVRAVIMVSIAAWALWRARRPDGFRVLALAVLAVLMVDPWAVLSAGFWLSFAAVAALMMVLSGRAASATRATQFARAQLAIGLLTAPLLICAFGQISLVAPLANLVAIPLVSLLIVPSLLFGLAVSAEWAIAFAAWLTECLMRMLETMATLPLAHVAAAQAPLPVVVLAVVGVLLALLPRGTPWRLLGVVWCVPVLLWSPQQPEPGSVEATVIDVGQGLAVLVRTAGHAMLYDTGRRYYRGGDAGRSVVLPYLRTQGIHTLDRLVLSHDDSDHIGGAESVMSGVRVASILAGPGVALDGVDVQRCRSGVQWTWDGVVFDVLHPEAGVAATNDNDRSCVISVRAGERRLLLTGDITQAVERRLLAARLLDDAEVVLAPHHGSKSSSSQPFIDALKAEHVVFSAGFANAYGHPAAPVVDRWVGAGARAWDTGRDGAIAVRIDPAHAEVSAWRDRVRRYWHRDRPVPVYAVRK